MANTTPEKIVKLSDRDHILLRPGMYVGGIKAIDVTDFFIENDRFAYTTKSYIPGLIKIIFEAIDNAVDVAIKSNFEFANKISVTIGDDYVEVVDNGYGISQEVDPNTGLSSVILAVGNAKAGSNFESDNDTGALGTYGVGIYLSNVLSKKFICETKDGKSLFRAEFKDNASEYTTETKKGGGKPGTTIKFYPDLERFGIDKIGDIYKTVVYQRLLILAASYPEIQFKFDSNPIKVKSPKQFAEMFGATFEVVSFDNGFIAYYPASADEFTHFTIINGQMVRKGGTHVDYLNNKVVGVLREKLSKKYKDIKPSDIRNKIMLVSIFRKFPNATFEGQVKEELNNSASDISKYLSGVDLDAFGLKIYRNKTICELITEMYRIKEEFQKQKDMQKLGKKTGKVRSDKYHEPIGDQNCLFIVEGDSALGGLIKELGRKGKGYFAIRGKMLNVLEESASKIASNIEIDSLIKILEATPQHFTLATGGNYYQMVDSSGEKYIVHDQDTFYNSMKWVPVSMLLNKNQYTFEKIERVKIDPIVYFTQKFVNQPFTSSYKHICISTDADLDGLHIRGLILTLFDTLLLPLLKAGKLKYLNTPVIALKKGGKIDKYFFTFEEYKEFLTDNPNIKGEWKYYKGLGSWADGELKSIVDKEGLDNFLTTFEYDDEAHKTLVNWMSEKTSDYRKEQIRKIQLDASDA